MSLFNTREFHVNSYHLILVYKRFIASAAPMSRYCSMLNRFDRLARAVRSLHFYRLVFCSLKECFVNRFWCRSPYLFTLSIHLRLEIYLLCAISTGYFICRFILVMLFYVSIRLIAVLSNCVFLFYLCNRALCFSDSHEFAKLLISSILSVGCTVIVYIIYQWARTQ